MKNILITGTSGFIGSHLAKKLDLTNKVVGIDNLSSLNEVSKKRSSLFESTLKMSVHSDFVDLLNDKPEIIVHLAAETGIAASLKNPSLYFFQNIEGTLNVLEQCRKNGIKYLIYASSSSVYEPNQSRMSENSPHNSQLSFYGTTKRMSEIMVENYCRQYGLVAIGLRFFTVYGSWVRTDMAAYRFMKLIDNNEPITLYNNGNVYRDFTHVSDVIECIVLLIDKIMTEKKGFHKILNVGFGAPISVKKYAETIAIKMKKDFNYKSCDLPKNELVSTHCNNKELENYINFKPKCDLEKGVVEMTNWYNKFKLEL